MRGLHLGHNLPHVKTNNTTLPVVESCESITFEEIVIDGIYYHRFSATNWEYSVGSGCYDGVRNEYISSLEAAYQLWSIKQKFFEKKISNIEKSERVTFMFDSGCEVWHRYSSDCWHRVDRNGESILPETGAILTCLEDAYQSTIAAST